MTLPFDYARCHGRDWPECADCLRRLSPWRPDGNQVFIAPEHRGPEGCEARINRATQAQADALRELAREAQERGEYGDRA